MDIIDGLNNLREFSHDTVIDHRGDIMDPDNLPGSPDQGKPDDYGLRGNKPNFPINSVGGRRMAGQGIMGAIAGELAPYLVEPARQIIQPAFNFLISETTGAGIPTPLISSR